MSLNISQKKFLRGLAHNLKPVVRIGQHGLSDNVMQEIRQALEYHELIKIKVGAEDQTERDTFIEQIISITGASLIHKIGYIAVFYQRNHKKPKIQLPRN